MLGEEKNYPQLVAGPWQGPLALGIVVLLKGDSYIVYTSTFSGIWQFLSSLSYKEITQVTSHNVHGD